MAYIEVDNETFDETMEKADLAIVDFWAPWCGPCRSFGPVFEDVARENDDITFAKCNVDENSDAAGRFGVRSIPTVAVFSEGKPMHMQPGAMTKDGFEAFVRQVRDKIKEA